MKKNAKYLFIFGVLLLLLAFTAPIWQITLEAPQYPSGVTMYIWINQITGQEAGTLQNINILNHYVGMKMIEPESIPELSYFPKVIIGMVVLGIILGFVNNPKLWLGWSIIMVLLGVFGLYDFYLWEYDYGHNLSPEAPIKIPGMAYQPPLFGEKMLLNFNAKSYPYLGSLYIGVSIITGFITFLLSKKYN